MTTVTIQEDVLRLHFDRFDMEDYALFLKAKKLPEMLTLFDPESESYTIETPARYAALFDALPPAKPLAALPLASFLFEDQAAIVQMALDAKRFACWSDCGLGKTLIQLELARHVIRRTGGRVLIDKARTQVAAAAKPEKTLFDAVLISDFPTNPNEGELHATHSV